MANRSLVKFQGVPDVTLMVFVASALSSVTKCSDTSPTLPPQACEELCRQPLLGKCYFQTTVWALRTSLHQSGHGSRPFQGAELGNTCAHTHNTYTTQTHKRTIHTQYTNIMHAHAHTQYTQCTHTMHAHEHTYTEHTFCLCVIVNKGFFW